VENLNDRPADEEEEMQKGRRRCRRSRGLSVEESVTTAPKESLPSNSYQILGRKWLIVEGNKAETEVDQKQTGVVGVLPVIGPGETFEYMSGTDIMAGGEGVMSGGFYLSRVPIGTESSHTDDLSDVLSFVPDFFLEVKSFRLEETIMD